MWVPLVNECVERSLASKLEISLKTTLVNVNVTNMLRVLSKKSLAFGANAEHASEKLCRNFLRRRPISSLPQKRALHNFQNSSRSDRTIMLLGWWKCVLRGEGWWGCWRGGWCEDTTFSPTFALIIKDAFRHTIVIQTISI